MESKEWRRDTCFGCLEFLGIDKAPLKTWKAVISDYTRDLHRQIEFDLNDNSDEDLPRAGIISQLSVFAILVSKEFDAALKALVIGEWDSFDRLFNTHKKQYELEGFDWHEFRTEEIFLWCRQLAQWVEQAHEGLCLPPVREIELWEKRLWCEEIARSLPRSAAPFEQDDGKESPMDSKRLWRRRNVANRLHISIDPFTPVEIVAKKVMEIVKRYQDERTKGFIDDFQHEIDQGALKSDIVQQWAEEDRLQYDARRTNRNIRHRTIKRDLEINLRSLRIYNLRELKLKQMEIAEITGHPEAWEKYITEGEENKISSAHKKDLDRAKKLIVAALQGNSPLTT
jgi:hypothetical protein